MINLNLTNFFVTLQCQSHTILIVNKNKRHIAVKKVYCPPTMRYGAFLLVCDWRPTNSSEVLFFSDLIIFHLTDKFFTHNFLFYNYSIYLCVSFGSILQLILSLSFLSLRTLLVSYGNVQYPSFGLMQVLFPR